MYQKVVSMEAVHGPIEKLIIDAYEMSQLSAIEMISLNSSSIPISLCFPGYQPAG